MPPSGEINSPLLRQVDHLSRALFGRKTCPSKLPPCLIYVNTVITLVAHGQAVFFGEVPNCPNYSPAGPGREQRVLKLA
jgi:hypothetical protein